MTSLPPTLATVSLRSVRLRARLPRVALFLLVGILCVAGLKAIVRGKPAAPAPPRVTAPPIDAAAVSFAEGFARAYLSWSSEDAQERDGELARYLPAVVSGDGGLRPVSGVDQQVAWTAVAGVTTGSVTVLAQTVTTYPPAKDAGAGHSERATVYLDVPVGRDRKGFLYVKDYPAVVGAPPVTHTPRPPVLPPVQDARLATVVGRALTNYLSGARENLLADLTPDAVVSLPAQRMRVTAVGDVAWVRPDRRVAVQVEAATPAGQWTLRYALDVWRSDRWYVRSIQVDPTFKGAR
jgi:hypothetical protein